MNQIVNMFQESNRRLEKITKGDYNKEQMSDAYREFSGQIKLVNAVIMAYAVSSKNKRAMGAFKKMNLVDDETAINLGLPDSDMIQCDKIKKIMLRSDCLDYSGDHVEDCQHCENFATTRRLILGDK